MTRPMNPTDPEPEIQDEATVSADLLASLIDALAGRAGAHLGASAHPGDEGSDRVVSDGAMADRDAGDSASAELGQLARLAVDLGRIAPAQISPAARARIQTALQDELGTLPAALPGHDRQAAGRWIAGLRLGLVLRVVASLGAVVLAFGSAIVASANSLPGDPLYGVKRWHESIRLSLADQDPESQVQLRLELAEERVVEIAALSRQGRPIPADAVADLLGGEQALHALAASASTETQDAVEESTKRHESTLRKVSDSDAALGAAADALAELVPAPPAAPGPVQPAEPPVSVPVASSTATPAATTIETGQRVATPRPTTSGAAAPVQTPVPPSGAPAPTSAPVSGGEGGGSQPGGGSGGSSGVPAPATSEPATSVPADSTPEPEATNPNAGEREKDLQTPVPTRRPRP